MKVERVLYECGLCASTSQARQLVEQGGVRVECIAVSEPVDLRRPTIQDLPDGKYELRVDTRACRVRILEGDLVFVERARARRVTDAEPSGAKSPLESYVSLLQRRALSGKSLRTADELREWLLATPDPAVEIQFYACVDVGGRFEQVKIVYLSRLSRCLPSDAQEEVDRVLRHALDFSRSFYPVPFLLMALGRTWLAFTRVDTPETKTPETKTPETKGMTRA